MSTCPKCKKEFNDDFKRYVVGTATNAIKFTTASALVLGGTMLGMAFGHHGAHLGNEAGTKIAEGIGCNLDKDLNGWKHKCPYCGYQWD